MTILLRPAGTRLEGLGSRTAGPCTTSYSQPKQIASWRRAAPAGVQQRGRRLMLATPREPVPIIDTGFMEGRPEPNEVTPFVKNPPLPPASEGQTGTGTLRPEETWYPAKMKYRTRDDNLEFWQEKFQRNIDIPAIEKRWTLFSTVWWLVMQLKYLAIPPALRFLAHVAWRGLRQKAYEAHKSVVIYQCKLDAWLASRASGGSVTTFWLPMALARLHWRHTLLAEMLYLLNVYKTGRVWMVPPAKAKWQRPTFFILF